jgi:hypothetical protein
MRSDGPYSLGFRFHSSVEGAITRIETRIGATQTVDLSVWNASGSTRLWGGTASGSEWIHANLTFLVVPGTSYWVSQYLRNQGTNGWYETGYDMPQTNISGPVTVTSVAYINENDNLFPSESFDDWMSYNYWWGPRMIFTVSGGPHAQTAIIG